MTVFIRPEHKLQILPPGGLFFGKAPSLAYTLLGSCVSFTVWHPGTGLGGLCHYLLAQRSSYQKNDKHPEGYYASDAVDFFVRKLSSHHLKISNCIVKMFGGGCMLNDMPRPGLFNVSETNIEKGRALFEQAGFRVEILDVGGNRYRKVYFDLKTGDVWVKYGRDPVLMDSNPA